MSYRIEDVLESVAEGAPAPRTSTDDIIAGAHRIRVRRRWTAVAGAGGAAAVTVAVVVAVTGTAPHAARPQPPAASAAVSPAPVAARDFAQPKGLELTVAEARAGKWRIGPGGTATAGYQQIPVYRDGMTMETDGVAYPYPDGTLTFYKPGVYDIEAFGVTTWPKERYGPPRNVTVAGRPGIERQLTYVLPNVEDMRARLRANPGMRPDDPSIRTETFTRTAFAWRFDGTAWATFVPSSSREPLSRAESLAIVEAVRPRTAEPVRAPYTLGWLPPGWSVTLAEQGPTDMASRVFLDREAPAGGELALPVDEYPARGRLTIWVGTPKSFNAPGKGETMKCVDVNGYCTLVVDGNHFAELQRVGKALSMDDVRRILRGLTFTAVADRSAWKPLP
ncbi:hypothetical protein Ade02nite_40080 [Paractinoplanes deccanensis]|uniref:Uncharacterized protein n=1 Tax=Paractinoplanes deccanensis TaxID=113561 RepID=A0ABQ3Y5V6_9ACTN|nr:hypothetical protein [Actinoplanes deccanensis]GID75367.1 hypothetical protein Ade02nite_40080 [Actinoplanes deccanensis]